MHDRIEVIARAGVDTLRAELPDDARVLVIIESTDADGRYLLVTANPGTTARQAVEMLLHAARHTVEAGGESR